MHDLVERRPHTFIRNVAFDNSQTFLFVQGYAFWKCLNFTNSHYTNPESGGAEPTKA